MPRGKVTPQRDMGFHKIAERIYRFEEVESLYLMSGGFDLMVNIQGKSMKEVARFVSEKLSTLEYVNLLFHIFPHFCAAFLCCPLKVNFVQLIAAGRLQKASLIFIYNNTVICISCSSYYRRRNSAH